MFRKHVVRLEKATQDCVILVLVPLWHIVMQQDKTYFGQGIITSELVAEHLVVMLPTLLRSVWWHQYHMATAIRSLHGNGNHFARLIAESQCPVSDVRIPLILGWQSEHLIVAHGSLVASHTMVICCSHSPSPMATTGAV